MKAILFVMALATGCATQPATPGGGGADGKADGDGAKPVPYFVPSKLLGARAGVTEFFANEADALAAAMPEATAGQNAQLAQCATDLGVAPSNVFARFGDCTVSVNGPLAPNGTWQGTYSCAESYCAVRPLDDAELVHFDGIAPLHTDSGNPLHAGGAAILVFDVQSLARLVSTIGTDGTVALGPHLYVRVADTTFSEAPGAIPFTLNVGDIISFTFAPGGRRAVVVALPDDADRMELYMRYQRFTYTDFGLLSESLFRARVTGAASDGYVSNFGNNFRVPVE